MSIESAVVELSVPAVRRSTEREGELIAVIRRRLDRPRASHERPSFRIGPSYLFPDRRRRYEGGVNWVHTHH